MDHWFDTGMKILAYAYLASIVIRAIVGEMRKAFSKKDGDAD